MKQMKGVIIVTLLMLAFLIPPANAEEPYEFTQCLSGTITDIYPFKPGELPPALSWAENGITMSDDNRFNNMTIHCEGVQFGAGPNRRGYGLCKATDPDGDMIIYGGEYGAPGPKSTFKFMAGTGKWKGVKGTELRQRLVRSKPFKGAMPGTYQVCHKVTGTFELPPK